MKMTLKSRVAQLRAAYSLPTPCLFVEGHELVLQLHEDWGHAEQVARLGHYGCTWSQGPLTQAVEEAAQMLKTAFGK